MSLKYTLKAYEILDDPKVNGQKVRTEIQKICDDIKIESETVKGENSSTDFIKIRIPGNNSEIGKTMGVIGRLGGIGARPDQIGLVSDADGAICAIATAMKLADMYEKGDRLSGDVIITTHICPNAPTEPHDPVPFMGSPISIETMNKKEVTESMEAILSIDTTKGNNIINHKGFAISPTAKEGYILKISEDLLRIMEYVTGGRPVTFPITTQDITPYKNNLHHINSIMQPSTATKSPVIGIATTAETPVPGCSTGSNYISIIEEVSRFCIEVAKNYTKGECQLYDKEEFKKIKGLYGSMTHLQKV